LQIFQSLFPLAKAGINIGKQVLQSDLAKSVGTTALDIGTTAAKNLFDRYFDW